MPEKCLPHTHMNDMAGVSVAHTGVSIGEVGLGSAIFACVVLAGPCRQFENTQSKMFDVEKSVKQQERRR